MHQEKQIHISFGFNKLGLFLLFLCCFGAQTQAQNHLYSTEQFGIEGAMLGGAVTAGVDDVSMAFYNPAAINKVASQLSISFIQPTIRSFGFEHFWRGEETDGINTSIGLKPTLISYKTKVKGIDLAFLKISKSEFSDEFSTKQERLLNQVLVSNYFEYEYSGRDSWYGIGSNFKVGKKMHLGLSQFVSISRFTYRNKILNREEPVNPNNNPRKQFSSTFDGTYANTGFISKIGFLYDGEKHDLGITITTPLYLRINQSGDILSNTISTPDSFYLTPQVIDSDIEPEIRTPWEINMGYSLELNQDQKVWLNASYHSAISEYSMLNLSSRSGNTAWLNGSKEVFNFSLGYSHHLSDKVQLSGAFRTNNFAYENKVSQLGTIRNTIFDGNHLHYVIGSKFVFNRNTILFAVDYGSIRNLPNNNGFSEIPHLNVVSPRLENLQKQNISILITYEFILDGLKNLNGN